MTTTTSTNFKSQIEEMVSQISLTDKIEGEIAKAYKNIAEGKGTFWDIANILGNYYNDNDLGQADTSKCIKVIDNIRAYMGVKADTSTEPTTVVFGTSGWRGVIGSDFTVNNVHKVVRGIIDMMKTDEFLKENKYSSFKEVQEKGIVVFRDNRFKGDDFMDAAMKELAAAGIKVYFAGECPTGVGSALVTELGAAGSINFTPSHNPMEYAGLKFNPADGGPADKNLTSIIEEKSNAYMKSDVFIKSDAPIVKEDVDAAGIFNAFMAKSELFDIDATKAWLKEQADDIFILVDNMHGASRGYLQKMLGEELVAELVEKGAMEFVNENTDYSFHGVKPEPSAKNMAPLEKYANSKGKKMTLTVALDPDADRIRFGTLIDMNRFGALAYANFVERGIVGPIASTLPTSDFALAIAKANGQKIYETPVGFKYFRPYRDAIVAFEESDGISFMGHTIEKCAVGGFIMALDILRTTGMGLDEYYDAVREKYGYYYPGKDGVDVKGVSVEEWQQYKGDVVKTLQGGMVKEGDKITVGGVEKTVANINTGDGLKVIFDDNSWILLRPSGTEPKFRIYFELTSDSALSDEQVADLNKAYLDAGAVVLDQARAIVDEK